MIGDVLYSHHIVQELVITHCELNVNDLTSSPRLTFPKLLNLLRLCLNNVKEMVPELGLHLLDSIKLRDLGQVAETDTELFGLKEQLLLPVLFIPYKVSNEPNANDK